jgi:hypothetical protein
MLHDNTKDPVMIGAGIEGQLSVAEARSMFTLFAAVKAPLLLGSDPSRMGEEYLPIVKNAEILAINQDSLGVAATTRWASSATMAATSTADGDDHAPAACPRTPPPKHLCCDHPHCQVGAVLAQRTFTAYTTFTPYSYSTAAATDT